MIQIEIQQLTKQISDLKKKRNSLYARTEVLKLRGPNLDQKAIISKQLMLAQLDSKLSELEILLNDISN